MLFIQIVYFTPDITSPEPMTVCHLGELGHWTCWNTYHAYGMIVLQHQHWACWEVVQREFLGLNLNYCGDIILWQLGYHGYHYTWYMNKMYMYDIYTYYQRLPSLPYIFGYDLDAGWPWSWSWWPTNNVDIFKQKTVQHCSCKPHSKCVPLGLYCVSWILHEVSHWTGHIEHIKNNWIPVKMWQFAGLISSRSWDVSAIFKYIHHTYNIVFACQAMSLIIYMEICSYRGLNMFLPFNCMCRNRNHSNGGTVQALWWIYSSTVVTMISKFGRHRTIIYHSFWIDIALEKWSESYLILYGSSRKQISSKKHIILYQNTKMALQVQLSSWSIQYMLCFLHSVWMNKSVNIHEQWPSPTNYVISCIRSMLANNKFVNLYLDQFWYKVVVLVWLYIHC